MDYFKILREKFFESYGKVRQDDDFYYLYKHFSIDSDLAVLGVFNNSQLLYTSPNAFNDPYDSLCILDYDFRKVKRQDLERLLKQRITNKHFKERKDQYFRRLKEIPEIKNWGDIGRSGFHVTCFNNNPLNILMWSHYAQNHEGFMVEFKFKKIKDYYANLPIPVFYNDDFPILNYPFNLTPEDCINDPNYGSELLIKRLLNKSSVWEYEQEFRIPSKSITDQNQSKILVKYEPELISNVIFGARINEEHRLKLQQAVERFNNNNQVDVKTYQAKLAERSYKLEISEHPRL